jgi:hypothetical protein
MSTLRHREVPEVHDRGQMTRQWVGGDVAARSPLSIADATHREINTPLPTGGVQDRHHRHRGSFSPSDQIGKPVTMSGPTSSPERHRRPNRADAAIHAGPACAARGSPWAPSVATTARGLLLRRRCPRRRPPGRGDPGGARHRMTRRRRPRGRGEQGPGGRHRGPA